MFCNKETAFLVWHVKRGVPLTDAQKAKAVDFLMAWVKRRMAD